jgi:hypothetical protein
MTDEIIVEYYSLDSERRIDPSRYTQIIFTADIMLEKINDRKLESGGYEYTLAPKNIISAEFVLFPKQTKYLPVYRLYSSTLARKYLNNFVKICDDAFKITIYDTIQRDILLHDSIQNIQCYNGNITIKTESELGNHCSLSIEKNSSIFNENPRITYFINLNPSLISKTSNFNFWNAFGHVKKLLVSKSNIPEDRIKISSNVYNTALWLEITGRFGTIEIGSFVFGAGKTLV